MYTQYIRNELPLRYPRYSDDYLRRLKRDKRLAKLEAEAFVWIARGRAANIQLGRVLNRIKRRIKKRLGHGHWESYYAERFSSSGVPERTARTYMKMAREEHLPKTKTAKSADLKEPIKSAVHQAEAVTEADRRAKIENEQIYKLVLHLGPEEQGAANKLRDSEQWSQEEKIVALLKQLCIDFGKKGSQQ